MTDIRLPSLRPDYRALVFGASGGVGSAIVDALSADPRSACVHAGARISPDSSGKVRGFSFNLTDEPSIVEAISAASADGPLDLVFVATGMLHEPGIAPEKTLRSIARDAMIRAFEINTIGPSIIAKHALPKMAKDAKAIFAVLSARVGSITDNRLGGWHSYRASKAALNMIVKTCAIELARTHPKAVCVSLHPGTVDTALSQPFQAKVPEGRLFTPEHSAAALLSVIDGLDADQSGGLYGWDGKKIDF